MFGFSIGKIFSTILPYLVIAALSGIIYFYVTGLQNDVKTLTANNATLELSVKTQGETIQAQEDNIVRWEEAQAAMQVQLEAMARVATEARSESRRLQNVFANHNLEELARRKPTLIERRINSGTDDSIRLLECASSGRSNCSDNN